MRRLKLANHGMKIAPLPRPDASGPAPGATDVFRRWQTLGTCAGFAMLAGLSVGLRAEPTGSPAPAPGAHESGAKRTPGSSFTINFPEMPATFHALFAGQQAVARMTVFLPRNYDPARKHPLLVFLDGWDGGDASNAGVARALSQEQDFVCVAVPLFKATDPHATTGEIIMRDEDARYMWPYFRTMLAKLDEAVPNLAPGFQVLGGFSNGAHATQGLIDESEGEIARRFSAFFFVEGGGRLHHYELLKGKHFLMVSSSAQSRPRAEQIYTAAKDAGADASFVPVDVGKHAFPVSSYPAVRAWLLNPESRPPRDR